VNAIPPEQESGTVLVNRDPGRAIGDLPATAALPAAPPPAGGEPWLGHDADRLPAFELDHEPVGREPYARFALPRRWPKFLEFAFSPEGAPVVLSVAGACFWIWALGVFLWFCALPLHHPRAAAAPPPTDSADALPTASPPSAPEATAEANVPAPSPSAGPSSHAATPSPAVGPGDGPFRNAAAVRALDGKWRGIAKCRRGKLWGKASTTVTFAGDGSVTHVDVGAPFTGTPTGDCITDALSTVRVEPFGEGSAAVVYRVYVAPK
jgi:hypothetical protein